MSNILSPKWLTQVIKPERDLPWIRFAHPARLPYSSTPILQRHFRRLRRSRFLMAEGARFELAVHEVDAGFQDRWFQPLTHPSDKDFSYLWRATLFCLSIRLSICEVPNALATSSSFMSR